MSQFNRSEKSAIRVSSAISSPTSTVYIVKKPKLSSRKKPVDRNDNFVAQADIDGTSGCSQGTLGLGQERGIETDRHEVHRTSTETDLTPHLSSSLLGSTTTGTSVLPSFCTFRNSLHGDLRQTGECSYLGYRHIDEQQKVDSTVESLVPFQGFVQSETPVGSYPVQAAVPSGCQYPNTILTSYSEIDYTSTNSMNVMISSVAGSTAHNKEILQESIMLQETSGLGTSTPSLQPVSSTMFSDNSAYAPLNSKAMFKSPVSAVRDTNQSQIPREVGLPVPVPSYTQTDQGQTYGRIEDPYAIRPTAMDTTTVLASCSGHTLVADAARMSGISAGDLVQGNDSVSSISNTNLQNEVLEESAEYCMSDMSQIFNMSSPFVDKFLDQLDGNDPFLPVSQSLSPVKKQGTLMVSQSLSPVKKQGIIRGSQLLSPATNEPTLTFGHYSSDKTACSAASHKFIETITEDPRHGTSSLVKKSICQCDAESMGQEVPVEQVFIFDGQMYRLPDANILKLGKLLLYGFLKDGVWLVSVHFLFKNFCKDMKLTINHELKNSNYNWTYTLDNNERLLLMQRCSEVHIRTTKLLPVTTLRMVCKQLLQKGCTVSLIKSLASSPYLKKVLGANAKCSNCGYMIPNNQESMRFIPLCEEEQQELPPVQSPSLSSRAVSASLGEVLVGDRRLVGLKLNETLYLSLKQLVLSVRLLSLTSFKLRMSKINAKPIQAPPEVESLVNSIQSCRNTLWIDMVALRCICCMSKSAPVNASLRQAVAFGKFEYRETTFLPAVEDTTQGSSVLTINSTTLEIDRTNDSAQAETRQEQATLECCQSGLQCDRVESHDGFISSTTDSRTEPGMQHVVSTTSVKETAYKSDRKVASSRNSKPVQKKKGKRTAKRGRPKSTKNSTKNLKDIKLSIPVQPPPHVVKPTKKQEVKNLKGAEVDAEGNSDTCSSSIAGLEAGLSPGSYIFNEVLEQGKSRKKGPVLDTVPTETVVDSGLCPDGGSSLSSSRSSVPGSHFIISSQPNSAGTIVKFSAVDPSRSEKTRSTITAPTCLTKNPSSASSDNLCSSDTVGYSEVKVKVLQQREGSAQTQELSKHVSPPSGLPQEEHSFCYDERCKSTGTSDHISGTDESDFGEENQLSDISSCVNKVTKAYDGVGDSTEMLLRQEMDSTVNQSSPAVDHSCTATDHSNMTVGHSSTTVNHSSADHSSTTVNHSSSTVDHSNTTVDHSSTTVDHSDTTVDHSNTTVNHSNTTVDHSSTTVDHSDTTVDHSNTTVDHSSADHSNTAVDHSSTTVGHSTVSNSSTTVDNSSTTIDQLQTKTTADAEITRNINNSLSNHFPSYRAEERQCFPKSNKNLQFLVSIAKAIEDPSPLPTRDNRTQEMFTTARVSAVRKKLAHYGIDFDALPASKQAHCLTAIEEMSQNMMKDIQKHTTLTKSFQEKDAIKFKIVMKASAKRVFPVLCEAGNKELLTDFVVRLSRYVSHVHWKQPSQSDQCLTDANEGSQTINKVKDMKESKQTDRVKDTREGKQTDRVKDTREGKQTDRVKDTRGSNQTDRVKDTRESKQTDKDKRESKQTDRVKDTRESKQTDKVMDTVNCSLENNELKVMSKGKRKRGIEEEVNSYRTSNKHAKTN